MHRKPVILLPAALPGVLPVAAPAETGDKSELAVFRAVSVTIGQAGETALQLRSGTLAAVGFGDENGHAAHEAVIVGGDGRKWMFLVDTGTGEVFASALSSAMEDQEDREAGWDDEDQDGEAEAD